LNTIGLHRSLCPLMKVVFILTFILALTLPDSLAAQANQDSTGVVEQPVKEKKGSIFAGRPGKAMLMSLVIPGAGQIYNKSYLRVPFVWGAVGGMAALMINNVQQYQCYRDAYISLIDSTTFEPPNQYCDPNIMLITDPARMRLIRDQANKNKQLAIVGFVAVWLLQSIDAYVDAHLKEFDIKEDLSFSLESKFVTDPNVPLSVGLYVQF
jgi:hypothetical protein